MDRRWIRQCLCCVRFNRRRVASRAESKLISDSPVTAVPRCEEAARVRSESSNTQAPPLHDSGWNVEIIRQALANAGNELVDVAETTEGIPLLVDKPGVRVYGKDSGRGFLIKTCWETTFSPEKFIEFTKVTKLRSQWDENVEQCMLLGQISEDIEISYERYKKVMIVSQRDVLLASTVYHPTGAWVLISTSVVSPDHPPQPPVLRAHMHIGGFYLRPTPTGTSITSVSDLDFTGSLPTAILVRMSAMAMPGYVKSMMKAAEEWANGGN